MDVAIKPLPLQNLASFYIAKSFWNESFMAGELQFNELQFDIERKWEIKLTICRDEAINNLNIFIEKNKLTSPLKTVLAESVFLLHEAYHQLLLWKITYDQDNKIDIFQEGEFYAPNFFSANGRFFDNNWTKRLMQNQNIPKAFRFSLATFYYFASDICSLWEELLLLDDIPAEDGFNVFGITKEFKPFKKYFRRLSMLFQPTEHQENVCPSFFFSLARNGYEYAIYNRWSVLSNSQKVALIMDDRYFEVINARMDFPKCNVSIFLYSQLSEDRKKDLFQWSLQHDTSEMWLSLLFNSSGGNLHYEVLEFIHKLPIAIFSKLLQLFSRRIRQLRLPLDADLFEKLWGKILLEKHRDEILKNGKCIIQNLVKAKSFHNIHCIIKSFSITRKYKMLLDEMYGAGINILDVLCKEGEFDLLQRYLSYFPNDLESHSGAYNLRRRNVLKKFSESSQFYTWFTNKLSKEEQTEVKSRMEALTSSFGNRNDSKAESYKVAFSSRISIFEKHFAVKRKGELTYSFTSRQKRKIEKEIKPVKLKKI